MQGKSLGLRPQEQNPALGMIILFLTLIKIQYVCEIEFEGSEQKLPPKNSHPCDASEEVEVF